MSVPSPVTVAHERACLRLQAELPDPLPGVGRRRTTQVGGALTAAWGDPALTLRCSIPRSEINLTAEAAGGHVTINGIYFVVDERPGVTVFTASRVFVPVEVSVPAAYRGEVVSRLTSAIAAAQHF